MIEDLKGPYSASPCHDDRHQGRIFGPDGKLVWPYPASYKASLLAAYLMNYAHQKARREHATALAEFEARVDAADAMLHHDKAAQLKELWAAILELLAAIKEPKGGTNGQ